MIVDRPHFLQSIRRRLKYAPVVALVGPRQCGKTTLARIIAKERVSEYFDLENPADMSRLASPMLALEGLSGLVIIDEIQRKPELFAILRVLADRDTRKKASFLVLGSASPHLIRGISESLAGRVAFVELGGFDLREIGSVNFDKLWQRGSFPRSYLARSEELSVEWRNDFIKTFLERDIPQLGISIPAQALRRFWVMIAHFHGQTWNAAEFARSLGSSEGTARRYLDLLSGAYMVRQLQPWFENIRKRQVKAPKIYIRDSGVLHALLSIQNRRSLSSHIKYGASWEGFALEQVLSVPAAQDAYFWATHGGAELDLLLFRNGKRIGFEFKCSDAPRMTKSIQTAVRDLNLHRVFVVYPGAKSYLIDRKATVVSIRDLETTL